MWNSKEKFKPDRWIGIDLPSGDHLTKKIVSEGLDKSENIISIRSVIAPDDGTNLRWSSERENEWDTHKKNSKSLQGTSKSPRWHPDKNSDL